MLPRPKIDWQHPGVKRMLALILPALFGVSVGQLNLLLDTVLASFLKTGSVSWLYYADRLMELPLGIFGIAIATVVLPNLSRHHAQQSTQEFARTLDWGVRLVILIGVPAALALGYLAKPIIATLFHYRSFTENDLTMTTHSLWAYSSGVLAFMLVKVLAPGYFSRQDMKTPVRIAIYAMVFNMVLNLLLIIPFAHAGLALATSIGAFFNAGLLYRGLKKQGVYLPQPGWLQFIGRVGLASITLCTVLFLIQQVIQAADPAFWIHASVLQRILHISVLVVAGVFTYFVTLWLAGMRRRDFLMRAA